MHVAAAAPVVSAARPAAPSYWWRTGLLVLSVVFPTAYRGPRAALLLVGFAIMMLAAAYRDRLHVHGTVLRWALASSMVGAAWMLWGGLHGAPGVPRIITVYVIWPLVLTLALAAYATERSQEWVFRGLLLAQFLIAAYAVSYILYTAGFLPAWAYLPLDLDQSISLQGGFIEIAFSSLNSLLFLVPFSIAALQVWRLDTRRARLLVIPIVALGTMVSLISGRRALQLVVVAAPFITLALLPFAAHSVRRTGVARTLILASVGLGALVVVGALAFIVLKIDPAILWRAFTEGFSASQDLALNPRGTQLQALLANWSEQPFFGAGHGATAVGSLRSTEQPWAYELSYMALLFQVGVVGFLFYACAVGWLYLAGLRVIVSSEAAARAMIPPLVGLTAFLIGNATNPYLAAFDYLWTLFLPLAVINGWLLRRERTQ
jgi:hypothetical protein